MRFEGHAAMELEFALDGTDTYDACKFQIAARGDSRPTKSAIGILSEISNGKKLVERGFGATPKTTRQRRMLPKPPVPLFPISEFGLNPVAV